MTDIKGNIYCEYVTTERWKTISELDEDKIVRENYIIRSFLISTLHQIAYF
jgi:hypothetical protein